MKRFAFILFLLAFCRIAFGAARGVEFTASLPGDLAAPQPLVATGSAGAGDLVLVGRDRDGGLHFGWDHSGEGVLWGRAIAEGKPGPHRFQVMLNNLGPGDPDPFPVAVLMDGRIVLMAEGTLWPATAGDPHLGANVSGLASAGRQFFSAPITQVRAFSPAAEGVSWRQVFRWTDDANPASLPAGPVRLHLRLPQTCVGRAEPLIVAGVSGSADSIFIHYLDPHHIVVGYDHWGVGAAVSAAVPCDYGATHELAIDLSSFHGRPGPHGGVTADFDGHRILQSSIGAHACAIPRIVFGANEVGASSSDPRFTGTLEQIEF